MTKNKNQIIADSVKDHSPNLRNLADENPPWPSKTAANKNPSSPSDRTTTSSSISSLGPCRLVEPHRIPGASVSAEDCVSMAMAEQLVLNLVLSFTATKPLIVLVLLFLLREWQFVYLVKRNLCNCWLNKAISYQNWGVYWVGEAELGLSWGNRLAMVVVVFLVLWRIRSWWSYASNWFNGWDFFFLSKFTIELYEIVGDCGLATWLDPTILLDHKHFTFQLIGLITCQNLIIFLLFMHNAWLLFRFSGHFPYKCQFS